MKRTYDVSAENSRLSDLKLLYCNVIDMLVSCSMELQFNKKRDGDINKISSDSVCVPIDEDFCLLKPNLIMHKVENKKVFHKTNFCEDKEVKLKLCGNSTNCAPLNDGDDFECRCKKEFHTIGSYKPIADSISIIQKCDDINECAESTACPPSTDCINTYGGHDCRCKDGYKKKKADSDPKIDGCDELCNPDPCGEHGKCLKVDHHGFSCNCSEGYTGLLCNTTVPITRTQEKTQKAAIVGGVLGVIMFVMVIIGFVVYRRMKKSKSDDEEYAVNRQRGILSEVNRLRRQEERRDDDFPSNDDRPRAPPRSGGNRSRISEERMIPRVQVSRQRTNDGPEGRESSSREETPGRSKVRKTSSQMQYRNEGYDEEE